MWAVGWPELLPRAQVGPYYGPYKVASNRKKIVLSLIFFVAAASIALVIVEVNALSNESNFPFFQSRNLRFSNN